MFNLMSSLQRCIIMLNLFFFSFYSCLLDPAIKRFYPGITYNRLVFSFTLIFSFGLALSSGQFISSQTNTISSFSHLCFSTHPSTLELPWLTPPTYCYPAQIRNLRQIILLFTFSIWAGLLNKFQPNKHYFFL